MSDPRNVYDPDADEAELGMDALHTAYKRGRAAGLEEAKKIIVAYQNGGMKMFIESILADLDAAKEKP